MLGIVDAALVEEDDLRPHAVAVRQAQERIIVQGIRLLCLTLHCLYCFRQRCRGIHLVKHQRKRRDEHAYSLLQMCGGTPVGVGSEHYALLACQPAQGHHGRGEEVVALCDTVHAAELTYLITIQIHKGMAHRADLTNGIG